MEELIYGFLLQSGYPRASIVDDLSLLPLADERDQRSNGDGQGAPAFAIVDPDTADRLAVIDGVGGVAGVELRARATALGRYAWRFGGRSVQAFLVRVDASAATLDERVQFYRVWPDESPQRLTPKTFPDLATLQTRQLLVARRDALARQHDFIAPDDFDLDDVAPTDPPGPSRAAWLPGLLLAVLAVADGLSDGLLGDGLFTIVQAVLIVGAAALLLVPIVANARPH